MVVKRRRAAALAPWRGLRATDPPLSVQRLNALERALLARARPSAADRQLAAWCVAVYRDLVVLKTHTRIGRMYVDWLCAGVALHLCELGVRPISEAIRAAARDKNDAHELERIKKKLQLLKRDPLRHPYAFGADEQTMVAPAINRLPPKIREKIAA